MLSSLQDVYDQVLQRAGTLARANGRPDVAPTKADTDRLTPHLRQGLAEMATTTRRLKGTETITLASGTSAYTLRPHIDRVRDAMVDLSATSKTLTLEDGADVVRAAASVGAQSGPPTTYGIYAGELHVYPVPDGAYTVRLYVTENGAFATGTPSPTDPPLAIDVLPKVPHELERALIDYVLAQWFEDVGAEGLAEALLESFYRELQDGKRDPHRKRRTKRPYRPMGLY